MPKTEEKKKKITVYRKFAFVRRRKPDHMQTDKLGKAAQKRGKMEKLSLEKELKENAYPGRGIVIGKSGDGTKAVKIGRAHV